MPRRLRRPPRRPRRRRRRPSPSLSSASIPPSGTSAEGWSTASSSAAPATASASPAPTATTFAGLAPCFLARRLEIHGFAGIFAFVRGVLNFGVRLTGVCQLFRFVGVGCGRLLRDRARLFDGEDLLALLDQERLLSTHGGIGVDRDNDLEALLQIAQMRALVIEKVERDVSTRAHDQIVGSALEQRFLD